MAEDSQPRNLAGRAGRRWVALAAAVTAVLLVVGAAVAASSTFSGWPSTTRTPPSPSPSASEAPLLALDAGSLHACVLNAVGEALCWGGNQSGEVGTGGTSASVRRPNAVVNTGPANTALSAGQNGTCVVTAAGGVRCWGIRGSELNGAAPADVAGLESGVVSVSVGSMHQCAVTEAGAVLCWGDNTDHQLGDGTTTARSEPVPVKGLTAPATAVAAGINHTCALTSAGAVACWGDNDMGQLGDGTKTERAAPTAVTGLASGVTSISAGAWHTCAVKDSGSVACWGSGSFGLLGDGTTASRLAPVDVVGLTGAVAVSAGMSHTCAVTRDGGVRCWGGNYSGQLGDGALEGSAVPVAVAGLPGAASAVAVGDAHTCAVTPSGVACWGNNDSGELGDGSLTRRAVPTHVAPPTPAPEPQHTRPLRIIYVTTDGEVTKGSSAEEIQARRAVARRLLDQDPAVLDALRYGFAGATRGRMLPAAATVRVTKGKLKLPGRCVASWDAPGVIDPAARPLRQEGAINVVVVDAIPCDYPGQDSIGGYDTPDGMPVVLWNSLRSVSSLVHVILHEVGHDLGLGHAGTLACDDPVRHAACELVSPTDDGASLMSYVRANERFTSVELEALGLLTADEVVRVAPDTPQRLRIELRDAQDAGAKLLVFPSAIDFGVGEQTSLSLSWVDGDLQIRQRFGVGVGGDTALLIRDRPVRSELVFANAALSVTYVGTDTDGDAILDIVTAAPEKATPSPSQQAP